jgi:hypothetical protein
VVDADEAGAFGNRGARRKHERQLVAGVDAEVEDARRPPEARTRQRLVEVDHEPGILELRDPREARVGAVLLGRVGGFVGVPAGADVEALEAQLDPGRRGRPRRQEAQAQSIRELDPDSKRPVDVGHALDLDALARIQPAPVIRIDDLERQRALAGIEPRPHVGEDLEQRGAGEVGSGRAHGGGRRDLRARHAGDGTTSTRP